jgi:ABC-2 type transport system ATP-binding protein
MSILSLQAVRKQYRNVLAVNDVTFDVPRGSMFGLLGPNGAGKTSLIRIITTITMADSGQILFDGEPLNFRHPERIGYLPEERGLYRKMKVGDHLMYLAQLKGLSAKDAKSRIHEHMDRFEIRDWWNKKVEELSKGMQQKIQFIATVVHDPKLIILDEPFSGLDPINTNLIKDFIFELNAKGTTIIFSTHRMEQVEEICEHIVLINKGQNVLQGKVEEIKEAYKEGIFRLEFDGNLPADLNGNFHVIQDTDKDVLIKAQAMSPNELLRELLNRGIEIHSFQEVKPTVNEIFIRKVNEEADV